MKIYFEGFKLIALALCGVVGLFFLFLMFVEKHFHGTKFYNWLMKKLDGK